MSPYRVIPQHGCMPAVPLAFHPVSLFRSPQERNILCHKPLAPSSRHASCLSSTLESVLPGRQRQMVLAGVLANEALLGSRRDRQLRGAFGTLGTLHDLFAEMGIAQLTATAGKYLMHILNFHLAAGSRGSGHSASGRKP